MRHLDRKPKWATCAALAALIAACPAAHAATVVVGGPGDSGTGNAFPFGGYDTEYQQAYSASLFSGPISITGLTFYNTQYFPGTIDPGDYTLSLSYDANASAGPGTSPVLLTTPSDNIGADATTIFSGVLSGSAYPSFTISASTAFAYDPSKGDLLLDVVSDSPDYGTVALDSDNGDFAGLSRLYGAYGQAPDDNYQAATGLVTGFVTGPVSAAPEPSMWALMVAGVGLMGASLRFGRRREGAFAKAS